MLRSVILEGRNIGFVEAPAAVVLERLRDWHARIGLSTDGRPVKAPWPDCLRTLEPPSTRELLAAHGIGWTVYLNNHGGGGDPYPATSYLAATLGVRWVIAMHQPMNSAGHASTQLWLGGPEGEPPLHYIRTIAADAVDGHWTWETSGEVQSFERPDEYRAARIRDRFTRPMLVEYLGALGIRVDDDARYGSAVVIQPKKRDIMGWWARARKRLSPKTGAI